MDSKEYIELQRMPYQQRLNAVYDFFERERARGNLMGRMGVGPADVEMKYEDPQSGVIREMLVFGSNNYFGFANDPEVKRRVSEAVMAHGIGTGGSPAFSGYTQQCRRLEEKLASLSGHEAALLLPGGYMANLCWVTGLMTTRDILLYDKYSHASVLNAMKMAGVKAFNFDPDKPETLAGLLEMLTGRIEENQHLFVTVEGVRSVDGTVVELAKIIEICRRYPQHVTLMLDDAHGLGTVGARGMGTLEHLDLMGQVDIRMSTCSKAFGAQGAFLTADKKIINYLRLSAKPYVFTTAVAQPLIAAIEAAFDLMTGEPQRVKALHDNVAYMQDALEAVGFRIVRGPAGIIPVFIPNVPTTLFNQKLHAAGLFANVMEYPMVPPSQERVRLSIMSTHTREQMDRAVAILAEVGREFGVLS